MTVAALNLTGAGSVGGRSSRIRASFPSRPDAGLRAWRRGLRADRAGVFPLARTALLLGGGDRRIKSCGRGRLPFAGTQTEKVGKPRSAVACGRTRVDWHPSAPPMLLD
ncbi:hypothetical protein MATL_G00152550 [Megalops atlanticus]|uniref:Uncharacterized protein n=1 Tax=Megalops atlanticus TaxID=7932 RepID=A0A9D3PSF8_MEGAT|nr:hypothetical protein MATL_G00152550 [Megalops atlanticus]